MPRLNSGLEVFKHLTRVDVLRLATGTFGDTTTAEALVADAADVEVAASTNFTSGDYCFIVGSGGTDVVKIGTPATTMPFAAPLPVFAQDSGARFVEGVLTNVGHISENGVTFGGTMTLTGVNAATSRTPIAYVSSTGEMTASFNLLGWNNLNLLLAFGATETEYGAGTEADPYMAGIGQTSMGSQGLQAFKFTGETFEENTVELWLIDAQVEVNVSATIGSGTQEGIPVSCKFTNLKSLIYTPA